MTPPERVFALVVGIELYEAGDEWDLDGCVASALRIVRWLREMPGTAGEHHRLAVAA